MVKDKLVYTPIDYKTWDTLGFFILYMVMIIAFFYIGALLCEIKYIALKYWDKKINNSSIDNLERFTDSYANESKISLGDTMNESIISIKGKDSIGRRVSSESMKELRLM